MKLINIRFVSTIFVVVPVLVKATARVALLALIDLIKCLCLIKKDLNCSTMNLIGIKHTGGKENKK